MGGWYLSPITMKKKIAKLFWRRVQERTDKRKDTQTNRQKNETPRMSVFTKKNQEKNQVATELYLTVSGIIRQSLKSRGQF